MALVSLWTGISLHAALATEAGTVDATADAEAQQVLPLTPEEQALEEKRLNSLGALETTQNDAEAARAALESLEADITGLKGEQANLAERLDQAAKRRAELDEKISESEARLTNLNARQDELHKSLYARRSVLADVLAALQRIGRDPPPALLISPNDALSSVRSAILLGAVVPEIRSETEALAHDLDELTQLRTTIAQEKAALVAALEENEKEGARLANLVTEKAALQAESERRLELEKKRATSLAEKSSDLESAIAALEQEIASQRATVAAARQAEEERKARIAAQLERARELAMEHLPEKNRIAPAYAFSALKGALQRPVAGDTIRYFGADDGSGHGLNGELIASENGSVVRAPVDGWVVFAGGFRTYGQTLIIDSGEGYNLVLAGMDRIAVGEGQFVLAGEPVATMGATRMAGAAALTLATGKPTLYIELRKDGQVVDPRPWWRDTVSPQGRASNDT